MTCNSVRHEVASGLLSTGPFSLFIPNYYANDDSFSFISSWVKTASQFQSLWLKKGPYV